MCVQQPRSFVPENQGLRHNPSSNAFIEITGDYFSIFPLDDRAEVKNLFTKPEALPQLEAFVDRQGLSNLGHGGIVRVAFRSCFHTQFDELLASPLLAVLLFGLLRMSVTN
jgi:hypothetical protein